MLFSLDIACRLRYITPMPPPTPLPVIAQLIGLFRQGFWRRLAGRLFRGKATQPEQDPVEEFLLPILEAISRIAEAVQNGTYREPEPAPWPDEPPETSGRKHPPKPPKPPPIREPEPPWLYGPIPARPRAPRPPPAPEPAAERPSVAPPTSRSPERQRPSWPPSPPAARPPLPPPRVRTPSKKARPEPVRTHVHIVTLQQQKGLSQANRRDVRPLPGCPGRTSFLDFMRYSSSPSLTRRFRGRHGESEPAPVGFTPASCCSG